MSQAPHAKPTLTSYAQNFEDVILWRALKHVENGFYIDIGAQDPVIDSVSLGFYEQGWRGVHVEPTLIYAEKLRQARPDETVIQTAAGSKGGILRFFEIPDSGLSTGDETIAAKHRAAGFAVRVTDVPCVTLGSILDRFAERAIHWLKIDVEGLEKEVIEGWGASPVRPWLVVVESTIPLTQEQTSKLWEPTLLGMGYRFVYFDGLNRYYLAKAHRDLAAVFGSGPNCFDGFVLSGTSTSGFCSLLNGRIARVEGERDHSRSEVRHFRTESERLYKDLLEAVANGQRSAEAFGEERKRLDAAFAAEKERLETERAAEKQWLEAERAAVAERLEAQIAWLGNERAAEKERLEAEKAQLEGEKEQLEGEKARLEGEKERLEAEIAAERQWQEAERAALKERLEAEIAWLGSERTAERQRLEAEIVAERQRLEGHLASERSRLDGEIGRLAGELQRVYASRSWRLMGPFRALSTLARRTRRALFSVPSRMTGLAKRIARRLLGAGLTYFRARPGQKQLLIPLVVRIPGLAARLQRMAERRVVEELPPPPVQEVRALEPANQPASVRRAYARLLEARARSQANETRGNP